MRTTKHPGPRCPCAVCAFDAEAEDDTIVTRARVNRTEVVEVTARRSKGRRRYSLRFLWRGQPASFGGWLIGGRSRMRAVARAILAATRDVPRPKRPATSTATAP